MPRPVAMPVALPLHLKWVHSSLMSGSPAACGAQVCCSPIQLHHTTPRQSAKRSGAALCGSARHKCVRLDRCRCSIAAILLFGRPLSLLPGCWLVA